VIGGLPVEEEGPSIYLGGETEPNSYKKKKPRVCNPRTFGKNSRVWEDNIKMDLMKKGCKIVGWIYLV
jgi:hypothetical protein